MGELLCPHSAVGVHVAQGFTGRRRWSRWPPRIRRSSPTRSRPPPASARPAAAHGDLMDRPERVTRVDNDLAAIEALIEEGVFA
jgi:threonine synthase